MSKTSDYMAKKLIQIREVVSTPSAPSPANRASDDLLVALNRKQQVKLLLSPQLAAFFGRDGRPQLRA